MAGSLPGIPLSQQFSAVGKPLAGALLYIYAANTTTPQDAFQDQGLTPALKMPWPMAADSSGRIPMFYLADGSVHVRLTDAGGVVQFDYPSILVIGPSSGSSSGSGVDPTTVFQTGDLMWLDVAGSRTGWVRDNGKTIGNAVSGATERASADCQALYVWLYGAFDNTVCPVTGGRSGVPINDFNAGKQIQLPDKRGYAPSGLDGMGNTPLGMYANVPFDRLGPDTPGAQCGEVTHQLKKAEVPPLSFSGTTGDDAPDHTHSVPPVGGQGQSGSGALGNASPTSVSGGASTRHQHGFGGTTDGGNGYHNNTGKRVLGTFYRKL